jgi:L-lactate dehydrogenase complex protein LldG
LPGWTRWGQSKDFPKPARQTFRSRFQAGIKAVPHDARRSAAQNPTRTEAPKVPRGQTDSLPERFHQELTALEGQVVFCPENEAVARISRLLASRGIQALAAWAPEHLPRGLIAGLRANGLRILDLPEPATRAGLTGALAAAAETGTLVIPGGPGRPLSASLVPEIHIAVLRETDIRERLEDVLQLEEIKNTAAVVLVSGPSRTADIEMTLTIGVHGPAEVHVFCIR